MVHYIWYVQNEGFKIAMIDPLDGDLVQEDTDQPYIWCYPVDAAQSVYIGNLLISE